jgi:hypothetical protein
MLLLIDKIIDFNQIPRRRDVVRNGKRQMKLLTTTVLFLLFLTSCSETKTDDPIDSYKYWAGTEPADDIQVLNGQYWQSGHRTKEYILYLQIKPSDKWWDEG